MFDHGHGLHPHFHLSEDDRALLSAALGLVFSLCLAGFVFYIFSNLRDFSG